MATQIFVNLPVKDLDRSKAFFAKLGYLFNPKFTDATAACISRHSASTTKRVANDLQRKLAEEQMHAADKLRRLEEDRKRRRGS